MSVWDVGEYEDTAAELEPASEVAVDALRVEPGQRVLDVACGTGNAALVAARAGARVTGIDSAERLVGVARERVPGGEFVVGDATELPFEDGAFDAAVSVFGVSLLAPAQGPAAEIARVVRPGGRVAITAWFPRGPIFEAVSSVREAVARVRPHDDGPPPSDWSERAVLDDLLGPYGELTVSERELRWPDRSPEETWDRWERLHPIWIAARKVLEPAGEWAGVREGAIAALRSGAERGETTSPYVLAVLHKAA